MRNRETIRKGIKAYKNTEIFLYGGRKNRCVARCYCKLHKCYLDLRNLKERKCKKKNCKYMEVLKK